MTVDFEKEEILKAVDLLEDIKNIEDANKVWKLLSSLKESEREKDFENGLLLIWNALSDTAIQSVTNSKEGKETFDNVSPSRKCNALFKLILFCHTEEERIMLEECRKENYGSPNPYGHVEKDR